VTVYQASQAIYDTFDKVSVLYEGRQIFFGKVEAAKSFFVNLGFECPSRQVTADFLTSLTSPSERRVRPGFEGRTPSTPDEFEAVWKKSKDHARLMYEIKEFEKAFPVGGSSLQEFRDYRTTVQAKSQ
jgi:ABC-type multidrug transport system ATPase subunit